MERLLPGLAAAPNIHPLFVHFPIAFWLAALLFCCLALLRPGAGLFPFRGAAGTVPAPPGIPADKRGSRCTP